MSNRKSEFRDFLNDFIKNGEIKNKKEFDSQSHTEDQRVNR